MILVVAFITFTIISFTSLGFPYTDDKSSPKLQKFRTAHIRRTIFDSTGSATYSSNNVLIYGFDRNSKRTIENSFGGYEIATTKDEEICKEIFNCGSLRYPLDEHVVTLKDIRTEPNIRPTVFNLLKSIKTANSIDIEFTLELRTTVHFSMTIEEGLTVAASNIVYQERVQSNKTFMMGTITLGLNNDQPFLVQISLKVRNFIARG